MGRIQQSYQLNYNSRLKKSTTPLKQASDCLCISIRLHLFIVASTTYTLFLDCNLQQYQLMEQILVKVEEPSPADPDLIEEKIKSRRVLKQLKEQSSSYKFYSWDFRENYSYITYLKNFRYIFDSHAQRKRLRVFTHISRLIQTRNAHQIKSHHQKMMLRHRTVDGIIEHFRVKITRLLQNQPHHITAIQEINIKAEEFFRQEAGFDQRSQRQPKKLKKAQTHQNQLPGSQNAKVKVEQQATDYRYEEFKNSEILGGVPEVKTEENAPTICFLPN